MRRAGSCKLQIENCKLQGQATRRSRFSALSLFEVIVSLAILMGSIAAIGQLISSGVRASVQGRLQTQAIIRCESKMAEVVAGITSMRSTGGTFTEDRKSTRLNSSH